MPKNQTSWQKGQSGNPKGRPKKKLTQILAAVAEDSPQDHSQQLAASLWQFATTGQVTLGENTLTAENVREWFDAVKWIYEHIDGKHPIQTDTEITIRIEEDDHNHPQMAATLPPTDPNHDPSGTL